jgi:hypothetical protein
MRTILCAQAIRIGIIGIFKINIEKDRLEKRLIDLARLANMNQEKKTKLAAQQQIANTRNDASRVLLGKDDSTSSEDEMEEPAAAQLMPVAQPKKRRGNNKKIAKGVQLEEKEVEGEAVEEEEAESFVLADTKIKSSSVAESQLAFNEYLFLPDRAKYSAAQQSVAKATTQLNTVW